MQVVKLLLLRFTKKYGGLKLADLFNYEVAKIMYQFSKQTLSSHRDCLFVHSLPCMNAAQDLKLSKTFMFLNSQPPHVEIFLEPPRFKNLELCNY